MAKIQGSTQLIGGYNPLDWGWGWENTEDSFMFNFTDGGLTSTAKIGYVIDTGSTAVCCYGKPRPRRGLFCHRCYHNFWTSYSIYLDIGIPECPVIEKYEVFQVIKK